MADEVGVGSTFAGHRLDSVIGRGGMGVVYSATHLGLDRRVALKVINPALASEVSFRERFKRESRAAGSLRHSNIVVVHDAGEFEDQLYITMELVEGQDLSRYLQGQKKLNPAQAVELATQIGNALDAAHAAGLVHRDVKPANILVAREQGRVNFYLTDFGLTRHMSSVGGITKTGQWMGTLDYVAPEQIQGEEVDGRADTYALGCVLFEVLSGEVPFPRESDITKMWAQVNDPPPDLREADPSISPELAACVKRAMSKAPDDRFPTTGELAVAMAEAVGLPETRTAPAASGHKAETIARPNPAREGSGRQRGIGSRSEARPFGLPPGALAAGGAAAAALLILILLFAGVFSGGEAGDAENSEPAGADASNVAPSPEATTVLVQSFLEGERAGDGSGWVYDAEEGLVVTNAHVIGSGSEVRAGVGGELGEASVIGVARCDDIAVIQTDAREGMETMPLGSQAALVPGSPVRAFGSSGSPDAGTPVRTNRGKVLKPSAPFNGNSAFIPNVVIATVKINNENSGGPMVDAGGELVGVNAAIGGLPRGQGMAIGVERIRKIVPELAEGRSSSWIGFSSRPEYVKSQGRYFHQIKAVVPGTEADRAGLRPGDLVASVNGSKVGGGQDYCTVTEQIESGETVPLEILRPGNGTFERQQLSVTY